MAKRVFKKRKYYRNFINLIFNLMVAVLENDDYKIIVVRKLFDSDNKKREILGIVDFEKKIIKISSKNNKVSTLVHELFHIIFNSILETVYSVNIEKEELFILELEKNFYELLTKKQKQILSSYILNENNASN